MSETRTRRAPRRQLGQFFTPPELARELVRELPITAETTVLEPSAGDGAFVLPLIQRFMDAHTGSRSERLQKTLEQNLYAVEIDPGAHARCLEEISARFGPLPPRHKLVCADFFKQALESYPKFNMIVGNPPFGATIDPKIQRILDREYGRRDGLKIKKESYCFFIIRSIERLAPGGRLRFICSDTFLTIATMKGLREFLLNRGEVRVQRLSGVFDETSQPMVRLDFTLGSPSESLRIDDLVLPRSTIELTGNRSWQVTEALAALFAGPKLGDFMVASSGMTLGRNELFVREIVRGEVTEPYGFEFFDDPITLGRELARARHGSLSPSRTQEISGLEARGSTRRNLRVCRLEAPRRVRLPDADYRYYNKSSSEVVYAPPSHAVFWKDDGDAARTFKKNGNWYLRGVGGQRFFLREGLTWQLVSPSLNPRYLPAGFILDSGAPCAFLREHIDPDELWFILGWALSPRCSEVLKRVVNHTRNVQSKDFERLPYPFWVRSEERAEATRSTRALVDLARKGERFTRDSREVHHLAGLYDRG